MAQIISGDLEEHELLPSIRSLAQDIRISVMTVKKAYDELEKDGYINTVPGKGSYVASKNMELIQEQTRKEIEEYINKIIDLANKTNIKKEEIIESLNILYERD